MAYLRPGETIRLGPPWDSGDAFGYSSFDWLIQMPGRAVATGPGGPNTQDWTTAVVSGSYGTSNLVVDVTAPSSLPGGFADGAGVYDVSAVFHHGTSTPGAPAYSKQLGFTYDELSSVNAPAFDVVLDSFAEALYSAVLEPDGLKFYKTTLHEGMAAQEGRGSIAHATYPQVWMDTQKVLYCCARFQDDHDLSGFVWKLWSNRNDDETWQLVSTLPFDDSLASRVYAREGNGAILAMRQINSGINDVELTRSFDNGITWSAVEVIAAVNNIRGLETAPTRSDWHLYRGGAALVIARTPDIGRSWELIRLYDPDNPSPYEPQVLDYNNAAFGSGRNVVLVAGQINEGRVSVEYPHLSQKLAFSRSHDWGKTWRPPTLIDDDPSGNMARIGQSAFTQTLWITNGRDRLYISKTGGETWEARP